MLPYFSRGPEHRKSCMFPNGNIGISTVVYFVNSGAWVMMDFLKFRRSMNKGRDRGSTV